MKETPSQPIPVKENEMSILKYGLTVDDLNYTKEKISNQRDFLKNSQFLTPSGQTKSLLEVSFSPNHSERYYFRVLNKVNTLNSYALAFDLDPIFMTATLDAPFHEMLKGKFRKFYAKYQIIDREIYLRRTGEQVKGLVPNDDRYGYILDDIRDQKPLTVKQLYNLLSYQMYGFLRSYAFKKIKKAGDEYAYIRVTEPMKSGVPHYHMLLYVNERYRKDLYNAFHRYFSAPQNAKPLTYYENGRICTKPLPDGTEETQGFQWDIKSPHGYVLKYVLKSFRNVRDDKEIDYLQAWYIKHRIPRIITSHTLIPQWVYYKASLIDSDWFALTEIKKFSAKQDLYLFESDSENDTFRLVDFNGREIIYDNGLIQLYSSSGRLIREAGKKKPKRVPIQPFKLKFIEKEKPIPLKERLIPVYYEHIGRTLYMTQGTKPKPLYKFKSVRSMSINELWDYRLNFNFEHENLAKFLNIENELIRRGVLDGELHNLNIHWEDFEDMFAIHNAIYDTDFDEVFEKRL